MPIVRPSGGPGIDLVIKAHDQATATIQRVNSEIKNLQHGTEQAGQGMTEAGQSGASSMALMATKIGVVIGVVSSLGAAFKKAFDLAEEGAQLKRLESASKNVFASMGSSSKDALNKLRAASMGTVDDMTLMQSATRAAMLGVSADADQLANLFEIAAFRGRAMGMDTGQAFDDMARGIGRLSPLILDNLGIIVDAESTYGAYAEALGKSASELTRAEKSQALLNRVLEEGNRMMAESGGLVYDEAASFERLSASATNLSNTFKMSLVPAFSSLAEEGTREIEWLSAMMAAFDKMSASIGGGAQWWKIPGEFAKMFAMGKANMDSLEGAGRYSDALRAMTEETQNFQEEQANFWNTPAMRSGAGSMFAAWATGAEQARRDLSDSLSGMIGDMLSFTGQSKQAIAEMRFQALWAAAEKEGGGLSISEKDTLVQYGLQTKVLDEAGVAEAELNYQLQQAIASGESLSQVVEVLATQKPPDKLTQELRNISDEANRAASEVGQVGAKANQIDGTESFIDVYIRVHGSMPTPGSGAWGSGQTPGEQEGWYASGGSFRGWGVVGDAPGRRVTPYTELVYAPGGATVIPASQARSMIRSNMPHYAQGGQIQVAPGGNTFYAPVTVNADNRESLNALLNELRM